MQVNGKEKNLSKWVDIVGSSWYGSYMTETETTELRRDLTESLTDLILEAIATDPAALARRLASSIAIAKVVAVELPDNLPAAATLRAMDRVEQNILAIIATD